jgi:hypothetical protein
MQNIFWANVYKGLWGGDGGKKSTCVQELHSLHFSTVSAVGCVLKVRGRGGHRGPALRFRFDLGPRRSMGIHGTLALQRRFFKRTGTIMTNAARGAAPGIIASFGARPVADCSITPRWSGRRSVNPSYVSRRQPGRGANGTRAGCGKNLVAQSLLAVCHGYVQQNRAQAGVPVPPSFDRVDFFRSPLG